MTLAVRQPFCKRAVHVWVGLLWGMALLGMFLLPSNFRGGSETSHGHSLLQLWVDAADGQVDHHHHRLATTAKFANIDWLDPSVETAARSDRNASDQDLLDVGEHDDSTPAAGPVHLLSAMLSPLLAVGAARERMVQHERAPADCCLDVLLPPPQQNLTES